MKKKWCVTGAAGFLGSHVVESLLSQGQTVLGIDNLSWGHAKNVEALAKTPGSLFAKIDIRDEEIVHETFAQFQPDYIIHLAALHYIPEAIRNPTLALDINVKGTQSLLKAAREIPYTGFFFASTGDVYEKTDDNNHEQQTPAQPYNIYGLSKLFGEKLMALESQQYPQKKLVCGRIYNLIGPRETNPHIIPEIIKQLKEHPQYLSLGNIWPIRDYVPVNECAKAIIALVQQNSLSLETVNIATGDGQSVEDLIKVLEKLLDKKIETKKDPAKVRSVERARLVADVSKLKKLIGWAPTSRVESIMRELLKDEGLL